MPEELFELFGSITRIKRVRLPVAIPKVDIRQYWHPRMSADPAVKFLRNVIFEAAHEIGQRVLTSTGISRQ